MRSAVATVEADRRALDLAWPGVGECRDTLALCRLADGGEHLGGDWTTIQSRRGHSRLEAECGPLVVGLEISQQAERLLLRLSARARRACQVKELGLRVFPRVRGRAPARVLYNGYHSWDASGQARLVPDRTGTHPTAESWWSIGLADQAGGGLAAVAQSATRSSFRSHFDGEGWELLWCEPPANSFSRPLWLAEAGRRWKSDTVCITAGAGIWSALAEAAGARRPLTSRTVPQGWLSWYHYGPWITEFDVVANSARLRDPDLVGLGYQLVLVDDGWQRAYGDWIPNAKFSDGFSALANHLEANGQALGLWTAPFLVAADSLLAAEAPSDWFLTDQASGQRLVDQRHVLMGPMNVLDLRRAAVRRHLRETFAGLRAAGVSCFKIDFLYAGAYAGTRALRAGVRAIREGVGDAYLLACGAPLLPMMGLVDGCRVGPDTATPFFNFEVGSALPTIFGDELTSVARNLAARHFLQHWFQVDPDVALVGGNLTLEQGRQLVTLAALSGGPFFTSDRLDGLPPERLALLTNPEVISLVGGSPAVPDWEITEADLPPTIWRRDGVIAVFNWSAEPRAVVVELPRRCSVRDLWARQDLGTWGDGGRVEVAPGSVRLLALSG